MRLETREHPKYKVEGNPASLFWKGPLDLLLLTRCLFLDFVPDRPEFSGVTASLWQPEIGEHCSLLSHSGTFVGDVSSCASEGKLLLQSLDYRSTTQ
jgi:hypothetical protein